MFHINFFPVCCVNMQIQKHSKQFFLEEKTTIIALKRNTFWLAFYMISAILKRNRSNTLVLKSNMYAAKQKKCNKEK